MLGVDLQSQDKLLKYVGGLHRYLRHTILMFNPNNLDDVCVQATHLEARGKNTPEEGSKNRFKSKGKEKAFKGKGKKHASIKKEGEKITCKHCSREGHDEAHCWKLHPEMKPKKFNNKGKEKTVAITQEEHLGFESGDETKITTMGFQGNESISITSSLNLHTETPNEKRRIELFHIRVISKHNKIDTMFDSGSQANLISENIEEFKSRNYSTS